jgi:NADH:ubiquinone oxidoreductase subunit 6 (subunit J)
MPAAILAGLLLAVIVFVAYDTQWQIDESRAGFATTAKSLGEAFLKPYVVPFEVASVLLMTAMIGAIVLTREDPDDA